MPFEAKIARIERALEALEPHEADCRICPRACGVDRRREASGVCRSGTRAALSHALLHFGEEPVLSGLSDCAAEEPDPGSARRGSGTIFFTGCNLKCLFCQNYQISWLAQGHEVSGAELAATMLDLAKQGAANINLVSPTHFVMPILRALEIACAGGLSLPLVWNSNGYESVETIERLKGIVDVYLPDLKYVSANVSKAFSGAEDYFDRARLALQEMYVQQPDLVLDARQLARRGMIIRHLVLPGHADDSRAALDWIAQALSTDVSLSLMSQYRPCYRAPEELRRPLAPAEYRAVVGHARSLGFGNLFLQAEAFGPDDHLIPDFDKGTPFRWKA